MSKHGPVDDFDVKGKIVLVTGGGSGIGLAFARLCRDKGARILIGDLKLTEEAQSYVSAQSQKEVAFETCDVTSWRSLHDLISASVRTFGDVPDVYAPVAGVLDPSWSNFWDDTEDNTYKTVQINLNHPMKLTRLAVRALASADKQGVVCLVSSSAGIRANYLIPIYVATKHAILGLCKSLAQADKDQGVKVVCVMPGTVKSALWEDRDDNIAEVTRYSERTLMPPSTIAEVMLKLVESNAYSGGACVLKTAWEEKVVEKGWRQQEQVYDPSPRPEPDLSHISDVIDGERGKKWMALT
jgi:NAD(P)-dependent dehydrogenase (short-subunit alcohol dehydrogenase family)